MDERNQGQVLVTSKRGTLPWAVYVKASEDGVFGLQGMTAGRENTHEHGGLWFEPILSVPAVLRFFGDRVLLHEDREVEAPPP